MNYSEKTQRELDKYTRRLVRRQPNWLKMLFNNGKISFAIEEGGALVLCADKELSKETIDRASDLVGQYMDKNPSPVLGSVVIQ